MRTGEVNGVVLCFNVDTAMAPAEFLDSPERSFEAIDHFNEWYDRRDLSVLDDGRAARFSILR